jgi:hypothetical protein
MEPDLLHYLLATFPADDELVICGYRLPAEAVVDDSLPRLLARRHRSGMTGDMVAGFDRDLSRS